MPEGPTGTVRTCRRTTLGSSTRRVSNGTPSRSLTRKWWAALVAPRAPARRGEAARLAAARALEVSPWTPRERL